MPNQENYAQTIAKEARRPVTIVDAERGKVVALPEGWSLRTDSSIEALEDHPYRKKGTVRFKVWESFVEYVNRHKQPETVIYAKVDKDESDMPLTVTAVFNDHQSKDNIPAQAGWQDFRAILAPEASHEWRTWTTHSGRQMSQFEFAQFVDDNIKDISSGQEGYPTGTEMLQMALAFEISQDKRIKSAIRIQSGGTNIEYVEDDDASTVAHMRAFDKFMLGIPVFWRGQAYAVEAKLRYRVREGKLTLWYDLVRVDVVVDDAVEQVLEAVGAGTESSILYGEIIK
ncbi:MAG: DUF2303 family protein [Porticoccaceae bacterium]